MIQVPSCPGRGVAAQAAMTSAKAVSRVTVHPGRRSALASPCGGVQTSVSTTQRGSGHHQCGPSGPEDQGNTPLR